MSQNPRATAGEPPAARRRPRRERRLEMRINAEQDDLLREAAHIQDTTVSAFVLATVTEQARRVIAERRELVLSNDAFDRFIAELDGPAVAVPELVDLFRQPRIADAS
jgi:uncharacterized protein (DUF1778 family)